MKEYFKLIAPILVLISGSMLSNCSEQKREVHFTRNGNAICTIMIPADASLTQQFSAEELKKYLDRITGASFPINKGTDATGSLIRLNIKAGPPDEDEAYLIEVEEGNILLSGNSDRAILYAVYDLLGRLGCAWYAPEFSVYDGHAEYVPDNADLVFRPTGIISEKPRFSFRKLDVDGGRTHDADNLKKMIDWMPKLRYNTLMIPVNMNNNGRVSWDKWRDQLTPELKKRGIRIEVGGHGYQNFINAGMENGTLFKKHPDWFGKDSACNYSPSERLVFNTTNPEAVNYFLSNIVEYLKQHPEIDVFEIWPPDVGRWHDCPEWNVYGEPQDRQALLANQVDSAIKTVRKELRLQVIAYSHALSPPGKVTLNPDIIVDVCPIDQQFEFQIYDTSSENNSAYVKEIKAWRDKFPGDLGIYSYYRKYAWRSAPNVIPDYIRRDMHWYAGIPVQGISSYAEPGDWFTYELNHYTLGHVAWNPDANVDSLASGFFRARYGSQWETAAEAYAQLQQIVPVYGSLPFTILKSKEKIGEALQTIRNQQSALSNAQSEMSGDPVVSANLSRLLLMYGYAVRDLEIQYARASGTAATIIHEQIRDLLTFLEKNLNEGVFLLTGNNDFARFTKKYGLTHQSLLD